jgi:hypothetical protein
MRSFFQARRRWYAVFGEPKARVMAGLIYEQPLKQGCLALEDVIDETGERRFFSA